jgi:ankyrin repeat protein
MHYSYLEIERLVRDGEIYVIFNYAWHMALLRYSGHCRLVMVEYFFNHGANPNNRAEFGATGLMLACKEQDDRLVSLFLKHGANVNQQDFSGCTALHFAFATKVSNSEPANNSLAQKERIIQILLQHNVNLYQKNLLGLSVIDMAKHKGEIILKKPMNRQ